MFYVKKMKIFTFFFIEMHYKNNKNRLIIKHTLLYLKFILLIFVIIIYLTSFSRGISFAIKYFQWFTKLD